MPDCTGMDANTLIVLQNGKQTDTIKTGDTITVQVYFPDYYGGYEWKLFDSTSGKLTNTVLNLDGNGCGSVDIKFTDSKVYTLSAEVCGLWAGDTCVSIISKSAVTPLYTLYVGTTATAYHNRTETYPKTDTYQGVAVKETWGTIPIPVLNIDEGYDALVTMINNTADAVGRELLKIETKITDMSLYYNYDIVVTYIKPPDTIIKSMQIQLVPIIEALTPFIPYILLGIVSYLVLQKIEEILYGLSQIGPTGVTALTVIVVGAVAFGLLYTGRSARSLY